MKAPLLVALGFLIMVRPATPSSTNALQGESAQPVATKLPEFEVASIKPSNPNVIHVVGVTVYPGGRIVISSTSLKGLIAAAFDLSGWQITGGNAWVDHDNYDLEAKPPEELQLTFTNLRYSWYGIGDERLRKMLQALLIDRFQLKFHRDTKTGTAYLLEKSGKPLKLRPSEVPPPESDSSAPSGYSGNVGFAAGRWVIFNCSMPQLAKFAADYYLHTVVVDRTDLSGSFDYRQPAPPTDSGADYTGPNNVDSFLRLIPELGLKLERTKGPVETFVIDHAEKPTPN